MKERPNGEKVQRGGNAMAEAATQDVLVVG